MLPRTSSASFLLRSGAGAAGVSRTRLQLATPHTANLVMSTRCFGNDSGLPTSSSSSSSSSSSLGMRSFSSSLSPIKMGQKLFSKVLHPTESSLFRALSIGANLLLPSILKDAGKATAIRAFDDDHDALIAAIKEVHHNKDNQEVVAVLHQVAGLLEGKQKFEKAIQRSREAVEMCLRLHKGGEEPHRDLVLVMEKLGIMLAQHGHTARERRQGLDILRRDLNMSRRVYSGGQEGGGGGGGGKQSDSNNNSNNDRHHLQQQQQSGTNFQKKEDLIASLCNVGTILQCATVEDALEVRWLQQLEEEQEQDQGGGATIKNEETRRRADGVVEEDENVLKADILEGQALHQEAVDLLLQTPHVSTMSTNQEFIKMICYLANARQLQPGKHDEALALSRMCIEMCERIYDRRETSVPGADIEQEMQARENGVASPTTPDNEVYAMSLTTLGVVLQLTPPSFPSPSPSAKKQTNAMIATLLERALEKRRICYHEQDHLLVSDSLLNLANVIQSDTTLDTEGHKRATSLRKEALVMRRRLFEEKDHVDVAKISFGVGSGIVMFKTVKPDEADSKYDEEALSFFQDALAMFRRLRAAVEKEVRDVSSKLGPTAAAGDDGDDHRQQKQVAAKKIVGDDDASTTATTSESAATREEEKSNKKEIVAAKIQRMRRQRQLKDLTNSYGQLQGFIAECLIAMCPVLERLERLDEAAQRYDECKQMFNTDKSKSDPPPQQLMDIYLNSALLGFKRAQKAQMDRRGGPATRDRRSNNAGALHRKAMMDLQRSLELEVDFWNAKKKHDKNNNAGGGGGGGGGGGDDVKASAAEEETPTVDVARAFVRAGTYMTLQSINVPDPVENTDLKAGITHQTTGYKMMRELWQKVTKDKKEDEVPSAPPQQQQQQQLLNDKVVVVDRHGLPSTYEGLTRELSGYATSLGNSYFIIQNFSEALKYLHEGNTLLQKHLKEEPPQEQLEQVRKMSELVFIKAMKERSSSSSSQSLSSPSSSQQQHSDDDGKQKQQREEVYSFLTSEQQTQLEQLRKQMLSYQRPNRHHEPAQFSVKAMYCRLTVPPQWDLVPTSETTTVYLQNENYPPMTASTMFPLGKVPIVMLSVEESNENLEAVKEKYKQSLMAQLYRATNKMAMPHVVTDRDLGNNNNTGDETEQQTNDDKKKYGEFERICELAVRSPNCPDVDTLTLVGRSRHERSVFYIFQVLATSEILAKLRPDLEAISSSVQSQDTGLGPGNFVSKSVDDGDDASVAACWTTFYSEPFGLAFDVPRDAKVLVSRVGDRYVGVIMPFSNKKNFLQYYHQRYLQQSNNPSSGEEEEEKEEEVNSSTSSTSQSPNASQDFSTPYVIVRFVSPADDSNVQTSLDGWQEFVKTEYGENAEGVSATSSATSATEEKKRYSDFFRRTYGAYEFLVCDSVDEVAAQPSSEEASPTVVQRKSRLLAAVVGGKSILVRWQAQQHKFDEGEELLEDFMKSIRVL